MTMRVALGDIAAEMPDRLVTVDARTPLRHAIRLMNEAHSGAVLVTSAGRLVGILTQRDVLRRLVDRDPVDLAAPLAAVMTSPVESAPKDASAEDAMRLMSARHLRRLPVVEEGVPIGIVSMDDLMSVVTRELEQSVLDLSRFISGPAATVELPSAVLGTRLSIPARH